RPGRPGRLPRAARGGSQARPPTPRHGARSDWLRRSLAWRAFLAPEGNGGLECARGSAPARERQAWLPRGEDAADLREAPLGDLGPLGKVPGQYVLPPAGAG